MHIRLEEPLCEVSCRVRIVPKLAQPLVECVQLVLDHFEPPPPKRREDSIVRYTELIGETQYGILVNDRSVREYVVRKPECYPGGILVFREQVL